MFDGSAAKRQHAQDLSAEFILDLFNAGIPIDEAQKSVLRSAGYADIVDRREQKLTKGLASDVRYHLTIEEYLKRIPVEWIEEYKDQDIWDSDWMPVGGPGIFDEEYCRFIDSHIPRFDQLIPYKPFWLYLEQNRRWMEDPSSASDCRNRAEFLSYYEREFIRCRMNTLYALEKYGWVKEGAMLDGKRKWEAGTPQAFLLFFLDQGRSGYLGKGRQAAITSTLGLAAIVKMNTRSNLHIKYIAQDKEKGEEIFEDKIKFSFSEMPRWFKPKVTNDRDNLFRVKFTIGGEKGSDKAKASKIKTQAPSPGAVNGGGPDIVLIDEAPFIGYFDKMMREARPSMFYKGADGRLHLRRQVIAWGTGGEDGQKGVFEREYRILLDKWRNKNFSERLVPLFFDWTCRPGIDYEFYLAEKAAYGSGGRDGDSELSGEERMVMFRQHFPSDPDDMFMVSHKTLIPVPKIAEFLEMIYDTPQNLRGTYGYFEPVYDRSQPMPSGSSHPFKVIDARFVPTPEDPHAAVYLFLQPARVSKQEMWENRYWQGTDPIQHDNGYSKMASAIWDAHNRTVACVVNFRDNDPTHAFEQVELMGVYYRNFGEEACKEVVESNYGKPYVLDKSGPVFDLERTLVLRTELVDALAGGANDHGVDCKGNRKQFIITMMRWIANEYGSNIRIPVFWQQMRTFVCSLSDRGVEQWGSIDVRRHQDDVLYAIAYAYICRMSFGHLQVVHVKPQELMEERIEYDLVRKDGQLQLAPKRVPYAAA